MPVCKGILGTFNVFKEIRYNFEYKKYVLKITLVPLEILVHVFTWFFVYVRCVGEYWLIDRGLTTHQHLIGYMATDRKEHFSS